MAQLAIKGHATRGKEVIEILEMLGGKVRDVYKGDAGGCVYIINEGGFIDWRHHCDKYTVYSLEEFLENFPYKVGDKVTHSLGILMTVVHMYWDAECNVIRYDIQSPVDNNYKLKAMLAEHLQYYKEETMEEKTDKALAPDLRGEDYSGKRFGYKIPNGYEFDCIQNNEIIIKPIQPKYPKTYKECCEVLGLNTMDNDAQGYEAILIIRFQELFIARNTYWEIAGKMMRLGEPWKPDWLNTNTQKHCIYYVGDEIKKQPMLEVHHFLAFPTAKIRDTFYDNFKELIEDCKELL